MLPASAGMILLSVFAPGLLLGAPRIRGDDPDLAKTDEGIRRCSPHPRA